MGKHPIYCIHTWDGEIKAHIYIMQIIGVPEKAEKDQIVKSVIDLKNAEVEEGYSVEAVVSRQVVVGWLA